MFRDQPDYTSEIDRPNLAQIARVAMDRYLYGDPPMTEADHEHEERDPEGWRAFTVQRTRWRLAREAEVQRAEMLREMREDAHVWLFGDAPFRPVTFSDGSWLGEGNGPWDND